jgi:hypothetical protein
MKTFLKVVADCKRDLQDPHVSTQEFIESCGGYKEALFIHVDSTLDIMIDYHACQDDDEHYGHDYYNDADELDLPY